MYKTKTKNFLYRAQILNKNVWTKQILFICIHMFINIYKHKCTNKYIYYSFNVNTEKILFSTSLGVSPSNRLATPTTPAFPRNVPSRSTFHSGQNRAQRNHTQVCKYCHNFNIIYNLIIKLSKKKKRNLIMYMIGILVISYNLSSFI